MITTKIIITSVLFSFYFIEQARLPVKWKINYKPFNCIICLPFYVATALYFLPFSYTNYLFIVSVSCVISPFVRNFLYNIIHSKIFNNNKT